MKKIFLLLLVGMGFVVTTPFTAQALDSDKIDQNKPEARQREQKPVVDTKIAQYDGYQNSDDQYRRDRNREIRQREFSGFSRNSIGPSVGFGAGQTIFGIDSKFGLSNNLSLRPFVYFPSGGTNYGTALTYDLNLSNNPDSLQLTPFVGASVDFNNTNGNTITSFGLVGGVDLDLTDSIRLKGAIIIPFNNDRGQSNTVTVGAGFRF
jgi:hypothetical protein